MISTMDCRIARACWPLAALAAAGCQPSDEELAARYSAVVAEYCVECHDAAGREAGLSLEGIDLMAIEANAPIFENVARKLRGSQMPPLGGPRPDRKTTDGFVAYLEQRLDALAAVAPHPGQASIHRLNRSEYGRAVRDLLAVEIDPAEFLPADDEGYGFDNIADILRVSPSLLEQYLAASAKIAALAVGDPAAPAVRFVAKRAHRWVAARYARRHSFSAPLSARCRVSARRVLAAQHRRLYDRSRVAARTRNSDRRRAGVPRAGRR